MIILEIPQDFIAIIVLVFMYLLTILITFLTTLKCFCFIEEIAEVQETWETSLNTQGWNVTVITEVWLLLKLLFLDFLFAALVLWVTQWDRDWIQLTRRYQQIQPAKDGKYC